MKHSGPQIISAVRENLKNQIGRHLYGVLGGYVALRKFETVDLCGASLTDGRPFPAPVNLNAALMASLEDSQLKRLVQNEARLPQSVQNTLADLFDRLLQSALQQTDLLILKQIELLFAYRIDLNAIRARATDRKHILLLLPGEQSGDQITLFHEAGAHFHRALPAQLITESHLWELADVE